MSPAWQRYAITRLALAERRWLCDELAARGHTANSVIVSDDDNLDIAAEYGFPTVERDNSDLGERFNAGYEYAADQGADVFVHIGSDDWVHPDTFNVLDNMSLEYGADELPQDGVIVWSPGPILVAQRRLMFVGTRRRTAQRCYVRNQWGCIPWIIPRAALEPTGFRPLPKGLMRGIDHALAHGLGHRLNWVWQDGCAEWCVDWKSETNLTSYVGVAHTLADGAAQDPGEALAGWYPEDLIAAGLAVCAPKENEWVPQTSR